MTRGLVALIVGALIVGGGLEPASGSGPDLVVVATGADAAGEPMTLSCGMAFAAVPSNRFTGGCQISVGRDHVLLGGMDVDGVPLLTVVLNGGLTVHGVAQAGSGRFRQAATDGIAGFPMLIEIDPLSRAWVIRGDVPDGPAPDDQPRDPERRRDQPRDACVGGPAWPRARYRRGGADATKAESAVSR